MLRTFIYTIENPPISFTVGNLLREEGYTHRIIAFLKRSPGGICVNSEPAITSRILKAGDVVQISLQEHVDTKAIVPAEIPFTIIYEDEDLMIVDKPAGIPVHPSIGNYDNTLANGVARYYQDKKMEVAFRCINRLDRDTTGLLILAKNRLSAAVLSMAMRHRQIHRKYLAIVSGTFSDMEGTIDAPIGRKDDSVIERCVRMDGERAVTHYKVLKNLRNAALVELSLQTGRTHQIRVHMKHIGHPLPGDFLYAADDTRCPHQMLHSASLAFLHPITKEPMQFSAPIPPAMETAIKML